MKENNNTPESVFYGDKLQNQFTAYVEKALHNNRISYYRHFVASKQYEISVGTEDELSLLAKHDSSDESMNTLSDCLDSDSIRHSGLAYALHTVPEKDRIILRLRILYGYPFKRIAVIMNMTAVAVRSRYFRVIRKIRTKMEEQQNGF